MSLNQLVVTYGFEYDKLILFTNKTNICKSLITDNIVYCSVMIKDKNVVNILKKIKLVEAKREQLLSFIDDLASLKQIKPKWQIVLYNSDYTNYMRELQNQQLNNCKF